MEKCWISTPLLSTTGLSLVLSACLETTSYRNSFKCFLSSFITQRANVMWSKCTFTILAWGTFCWHQESSASHIHPADCWLLSPVLLCFTTLFKKGGDNFTDSAHMQSWCGSCLLFTSLLQTGRQWLRRSTLLVVDREHTDQVRLIRVNICKETTHTASKPVDWGNQACLTYLVT